GGAVPPFHRSCAAWSGVWTRVCPFPGHGNAYGFTLGHGPLEDRMKRWLTLAVLAFSAAACNDAQPLAPARAPDGPNALLSLPATVSVDPVLANVLRL